MNATVPRGVDPAELTLDEAVALAASARRRGAVDAAHGEEGREEDREEDGDQEGDQEGREEGREEDGREEDREDDGVPATARSSASASEVSTRHLG